MTQPSPPGSDPALQEQIKKFIEANYYYFAGKTFESDALSNLYALCTDTGTVLNEIKFTCYKTLLERQLLLAGITVAET